MCFCIRFSLSLCVFNYDYQIYSFFRLKLLVKKLEHFKIKEASILINLKKKYPKFSYSTCVNVLWSFVFRDLFLWMLSSLFSLTDKDKFTLILTDIESSLSIFNGSWENCMSPIALQTGGLTNRKSKLKRSLATYKWIELIELYYLTSKIVLCFLTP